MIAERNASGEDHWLFIPALLPGLNVLAASGNVYERARAKARAKQVVIACAHRCGLKHIPQNAGIMALSVFNEHKKNRDPRNIAHGAHKIIDDALQDSSLGALQDDGWGYVAFEENVFISERSLPEGCLIVWADVVTDREAEFHRLAMEVNLLGRLDHAADATFD